MKTTHLKQHWLKAMIGIVLLVTLWSCDNDDEGAYASNYESQKHLEIVQIDGNQIAMNLV